MTLLTARSLALALLGLVAAQRAAVAQNPPPRLPAVVVTATPDPPGPRRIAGLVRDTMALPVEDVEISIIQKQRRVFSNAAGEFRLGDLAPGKYELRARKIGYYPQVQTVVIDSSGGVTVFSLVPTVRRLRAVVSTAVRGGLSGTVGDTSYHALQGASVRIAGHSDHTRTDSLGHFYVPLDPGRYVVEVTQPGYEFRIVSVDIPRDSGRTMTVFLPPRTRPVSHESAMNLFDLEQRLTLRTPAHSALVTHAELEAMEVEWGPEAVQYGLGRIGARGPEDGWSDPDCSAVVNGGPETVSMNELTIDDIETIELYPKAQEAPPGSVRNRPSPRRLASMLAVPFDNTRLAAIRNATKHCPAVIYVWLR